MATAETARLIASLELQDKNFTRGLKQVERGVGRVDKKLGAFSGAVNRNVGRAVDNITARLMDVPGQVISAAVEQESAITGISKTVEGDITAIIDDLKRLSTETGSTFTELAGIAELGGAMGIAKDDLAAFTEQVAILGATTNVSVEDAATSLGQLQNVLGLTGDEFDNFSSALVDLGNKGASTEAQILEIARRSGGAAKTIGIATEATLGWASAAANLGLEQEVAGTSLQKFFFTTQSLVTSGGAKLEELADISGMSAKAFKKAWKDDAGGALTSFLGGLGELTKGQRVAAIQKLFGKREGLTRLLIGLSDSFDKNLIPSLETSTTAWQENTAAGKEAEKRFATSEFLFKRLGNSVNLAAATIGTELLPVLNDLATEGIAFLTKPATQKGIKEFATALGKGIRGLAGVVTSINWGAVAGFLSTAAGFAGQLVTWFTKMPDWAQAFLIGSFAVTKLPVIGDLVSELGKGLIKGVLGMTAGVVNINAGVVNGGGGAPIPGGAKGGPLGTFGSIVNDFKLAIAGLGLTAAAGLTIAAIAPIALTALTTAIINATGKTVPERELEGRQETAERRGVPERNRPTKPGDVPRGGLSGDALKRFEARVNGASAALKEIEKFGAPGAFRPKPEPKPGAGGAPGAFRPIVKAVSEQRTELNNMSNALVTLKGTSAEQKTELSNIKNASATLNTSITAQTSAQTAELANIKNASATLNTTTYAGLLASTAATTAGNLLSVFQSASQVLAANSTTTAANNTTTAARNAGTTVAGSMAIAASRIVGAVNALDLSVNVTTVNRTSTVNNRYGPESGSSNGDRTGGGWR